MATNKKITLSPSALNLFRDCPVCFWMDKVKGFKRPRGIFPSLPGGMDRVIKDYFDVYRKKGEMPPEFKAEAFQDIRLFPDQKNLDLWREWRTGLRFSDQDGSELFGALDDLMMRGDLHIPFDYKTKGSPTTKEAAALYYQNQMDCYALMLEANGMSLDGVGFLLYYSPKDVHERGLVQFNLQAVQLDVDPKRALKTFRDAVRLIRTPTPPASVKCEYCSYLTQGQATREKIKG